MPEQRDRMEHSVDKPNIAVIAPSTISMVVEVFLTNFLEIVEPLANEIYAITGVFPNKANRRIHIIEIKYESKKESTLIKILKHLLVQLKVSFQLFKISKNVEVVIFLSGTKIYLLPVLSAKLLRKKTILAATGRLPKGVKITYYGTMLFGLGRIIYLFISTMLFKINFSLADRIAVESESSLKFMGLDKYRKKITIGSAGAMYINTDAFKIKRGLKHRGNLVGYVGRLFPEKGVMNFIKAIPLILNERDDVEFLIGGGGPLLEEIKGELANNNLSHKVKLVGWIPYDELPGYLNELKLLILPSYSEGLPSIVQESMACGTITLATPVGGVPDLIKDEKTGFILENNSPECIARNVIRALEHPKLDEIAQNARKLIEQEYTYEVMVEKCRSWLNDLMGSK